MKDDFSDKPEYLGGTAEKSIEQFKFDGNSQVAGAFEDHYTNRYKKYSESTQAFEPQAEDGFKAGDLIPSGDRVETVGLPAEKQEALSIFELGKRTALERAQFFNKDFIEQRKKDRTAGKEITSLDNLGGDQLDAASRLPKTSADAAIEGVKEAKIAPTKELMLQALEQQELQREIIDPDNIPEGSLWNALDTMTVTDVSRRAMFEITEAAWEAFENTARVGLMAATSAVDELIPNVGSDEYKAWVSMLNDNSVRTQHLMRPTAFPDIKNQEHWGYGITRGITQFMATFLFASHRLAQIPKLKPMYKTRGMMAGVPADYLSFDPAEGNLHSLMNELGEVEVLGEKINLSNEYTRWMSSDMADSQSEGRFLNAIEGAMIGMITETALHHGAKLYGKVSKSDLAKKYSKATLETAKSIRSFRAGMADAVQRKGEETFKAAKRAFDEYNAREMPKTPPSGSPRAQRGAMGSKLDEVGPPAPEKINPQRDRMIDAMTEIALARIVKGDIPIGKPERWAQEMGGNLASASKAEGKFMMQQAWQNAVSFVKHGGQNPHWYSKIERAVLTNMADRDEMTGQQILDAMRVTHNAKGKLIKPKWQYRNRLKQGNAQPVDSPINPQEIKFSGLETWLTINKDNVVKKRDLVDFVRAHRVRIEINEHKEGRSMAGGSGVDDFEVEVQADYDVDDFINTEMTAPDTDLDMEDIYDRAQEQADNWDMSDLWSRASGDAQINEHMNRWGGEIESDDAAVRNDDGSLTDDSAENLNAQLHARMMQRIDFEDSDIGDEFAQNIVEVNQELQEQGFTEAEINDIAQDVMHNLEESYQDLQWITGNTQLTARMASDEYGLIDYARDQVRGEIETEMISEAERNTGQESITLDADESYFVRQDGDGDWEYHVNGEYMGYKNRKDEAIRRMRAYAVKNGVLDSALPSADDIASPSEIIKTGFQGSSYSNYTFANISDYAYDDKYLVYTFKWGEEQVKADRDLLTQIKGSRDDFIDPELGKLLSERNAILETQLPSRKSGTHYNVGDYAHVRMTFRKPKGSDEITAHIEEFQSDYLQGLTKRGGKVMTVSEAAQVMENYEKLEKLALSKRETYEVNLRTTVDKEYEQWAMGNDSVISAENFDKWYNEASEADLDNGSLRDARTVLMGEYDNETRVRYVKSFVEMIKNSGNPTRNTLDLKYATFFGERFNVANSGEISQIAAEMDQARAVAESAKRNINPTPFDDKDFQKQLAMSIIKAMVDKGYRKLSWNRPWAESGSRNTGMVAWREVEVPPYEVDGETFTTAFVMREESREGILRESDLNIRAAGARRTLTQNYDADRLAQIKEGTYNSGLIRTIDDYIPKHQQEQIVAGTALPETKAKLRAWNKMQKSRRGYDSDNDLKPDETLEWYEDPNIEFLELIGYTTNYAQKLPKALLSAIQEFDPKAKINKGQQSLMYERDRMQGRMFESNNMHSLGDAKGIAENPYYGKEPEEILEQWKMSDEFIKLSGLDPKALYALKNMKYLPRFADELPTDPAIAYYLPDERIRPLFNNKRSAEKLVREFNTYDVEWIDLSGLYDELDGQPVKKTDGGVSVLGLVPAATVPAYMLGGSEDAQAAEQPAQ